METVALSLKRMTERMDNQGEKAVSSQLKETRSSKLDKPEMQLRVLTTMLEKGERPDVKSVSELIESKLILQ